MNKALFKSSLKVFTDYLITLVIFGVFIPTVLGLAKKNLTGWLVFYSVIIFILMFAILYSDLKQIAAKEKRPQYNLKPHPVKGLLIGFLGFLPFILLELVYPFIALDDKVLSRLLHVALNVLVAPMYFIVKLGNSSVPAYIAASAAVPLIAMLGYMAGYYGIEIGARFRKKKKDPKTAGKKL